jgi:hypothetical protein
VLTLAPDRGSCADRIVARGAAFPASRAVTLSAVQTGPGSARSSAYRVFTRPIAGANGAFTVEFALPPIAPHGCGHCGVNGCGADPTGERYTITAIGDAGPGGGGAAVARAVFTVTSASLPLPAAPRTGGGGLAGGPPPLPWSPGLALPVLVALGGMLFVRRRAR